MILGLKLFILLNSSQWLRNNGPLNSIAFNVGYHNKHYDFSVIPGSRLPELNIFETFEQTWYKTNMIFRE